MDHKETLHHYLKVRRDDLVAKLDGLSDYDVRRPLTPTGTNLLGLVKHVGSVQLGYFGEVFGRPETAVFSWLADDAPDSADMWATADETREEIVEFYRYSSEHADATIDALDLDSPGVVPWWPDERRHVDLQRILVHMAVEVARHAGHADILRESLDGAVGNGQSDPNTVPMSADEWLAYRAVLEKAARAGH